MPPWPSGLRHRFLRSAIEGSNPSGGTNFLEPALFAGRLELAQGQDYNGNVSLRTDAQARGQSSLGATGPDQYPTPVERHKASRRVRSDGVGVRFFTFGANLSSIVSGEIEPL